MRRKLHIGIALVLALVAGMVGPLALAGAVSPEAECAELILFNEFDIAFDEAYKLDNVPSTGTVGQPVGGSWEPSDPGFTVTVTGVLAGPDDIDRTEGATGPIREFSWDSDGVEVFVVLVKAGNNPGAEYDNYEASEYPDGATDGEEIAPTYVTVNPNNDKETTHEPGVSHITFCTGEGGGGEIEETDYEVSGSKFFDLDHDGVWDDGEPTLSDWPITATETTVDGVGSDSTTTGEDGTYSFTLPIDTTWDIDEVESTSDGWVRTGHGAYSVDDDATGLDFGNVCTVGSTNGHTLGFWTNKNGQATIGTFNHAALFGTTQLRDANGNAMNFATYTAFKNWLSKATAKNMSYMLSAQLAATMLNLQFLGQDGTSLVEVEGEWISIDDLVAEAQAVLAANPTLVADSAARTHAAELKNVLDDLNNNRASVTPVDPGECAEPFPVVVDEVTI